MIKLSLIVPIYGVEQYIYRFLNSLEKNITSEIEVILVDDGARDNSGKIADDFALLHPENVLVIHKENGGVSDARNKGLELAKGEYIIFPDPDDYLAPNYVERILNAIRKYKNPDMIFFDFYFGTCENDFQINTVPGFKEGIIPKEKFIKEHIKDIHIKGMVWCKAIKKSFYDGLRFNIKTRVAEDFELLTDLVLKLETIVYIPEALYYYIMRVDSLTHTSNVEDDLRLFNLSLDRYNKHSKIYSDISNIHLLRRAHGIVIETLTKGSVLRLKQLENMIKNNIFVILSSNEFRLNEKKQCILIYFGLANIYYELKYKK